MSAFSIYTVPAFLFVISIIVVIHELGHYWMARLFGTRIEAFAIGFGPQLFGWTDRLGTRWKVCLLPLGGYVKFYGDENAASVPDKAELAAIREQVAASGIDPRTIFHLKPLFQRALIVLAGPLANFVLAMGIFIAVFSLIGEMTHPVRVGAVVEGSAADEAGIETGDTIKRINGWKVYSFNDLIAYVSTAADRPLRLTIDRGGETLEITVKPRREQVDRPGVDGKSRTMWVGLIGISAGHTPEEVTLFRHGPLSAVERGVQRISLVIDRTFYYLSRIVTGKEDPSQLSGPVGIAKISGHVAEGGIDQLIMLIAFLSVSVGLINLFPIPVLDGGHLLFYAIEAIQGRPLSHRIQEIGYRIGLAFLVLMFVFVTWNDIINL